MMKNAAQTQTPDFASLAWKDFHANPLLDPPWPEWMIADPSVLTPDESPDGRWHMIANSVLQLRHYTSDDGVKWVKGKRICAGIRPFVRLHQGEYILFYEQYLNPFQSEIRARTSPNLKRWSKPKTMFAPCLPWHGDIPRTCGNPCIVKYENEYLLFYSAGSVFLPDCGFNEPRYIGVAWSDSFFGPYKPHIRPIISPNDADPYRNMGAGAMKVVADNERQILWGFNNGIYRDEKGRSRSAIMLLMSSDGLVWAPVHRKPLIEPEPGWKKSLVYAMDVKLWKGDTRIYYNAREGWLFGKERIGLSLGGDRM